MITIFLIWAWVVITQIAVTWAALSTWRIHRINNSCLPCVVAVLIVMGVLTLFNVTVVTKVLL